MRDITRILASIDTGDTQAVEALLPVVYQELRLMAAQKLYREKPGHTLQPTALVHEAYLRMVKDSHQNWDNRAHFFVTAAEAMRRILVENARRKHRLKRGGQYRRVELEEASISIEPDSEDLIALDEALAELTTADKTKADLVKLRFFAGMTMEEAAETLRLSLTTAKRHWRYAKAWLYSHMTTSTEN